jgi:signal peptidase I
MFEQKDPQTPGDTTNVPPITPPKTTAQSIWELVRFAFIAIIIVIPIRVFIAQPFIVSGSSMYPTFENSQYLIVDELSYRLSSPERDDVIVFRYPRDTTKFFIKRIIGLPGETINISGDKITVINQAHPDGFVLDQPFINPQGVSKDNLHFVVKSDEYFVMGDNREASSDSRFWGGVPKNLIVGRAFIRLFPLNKISIMPGNYKQTS